MAFDTADYSKVDLGTPVDIHKLRALKLAELLESLPQQNFNMRFWGAVYSLDFRAGRRVTLADAQECGTAACIAGWACFLDGASLSYGDRNFYKGDDALDVKEHAQKYLGFSNDQAMKAFYRGVALTSDDVPPKQAAKMLRNYAATGEVTWE